MESHGAYVTLLMTDVEGSTQLWERAPQEMAQALARHDLLAAEIIAEHDGRLVKERGEGDSLFAVLPDAAAAAGCAVALQEAFAREAWPTPGPLRVRIGIHAGSVDERDGDLYGRTVNRAARLRGLGHGGQILVSEPVARALDGDTRLRPLGRHQLRGITDPVEVFQLGAPGLRDAFPPLRGAVSGTLLERNRELEALADRLAALVDRGEGGMVLVEGPAGIGKSSLLKAATSAVAGAQVLSTQGSELEAGLAFGAVRQLFAAAVLKLEDDVRDTVLSGPAALALPVLGLERASPAAELADPLYGLFWLAANLAERQPLVLVVDDLHWLDEESGRFVAYLTRRLESLPILLLAGTRPVSADHVASEIAETATTLILGPLSTNAVGHLVSGHPAAEVERLTGGNPLLVAELGRALQQAPEDAALEEIAPAAVGRSVLRRVAAVSDDARALARAAALFAGGATLPDAAAVAGLEPPAAARATDALADAQIFARGEFLTFLHPVMRTAVYEELGAFERRDGHVRAANALKARHAPIAEIAAHLLASEAAGDPDNVRVLRAAADEAVASLAPRAAIRYLERAVAEGATGGEELRGLLLELGRLQRLTSHPDAQATLARAFAESKGSPQHARAAIELSACAYVNLDYGVVRATVEATKGSDLAPDDRLALDMLLAESAWSADDMATCIALIDKLPPDLPGDTAAQRLALVMSGAVRLFRCEPLETVRDLLRRALGERGIGSLVAGVDVGDPLGWLICTDALDEAEALAEERREAARSGCNEADFAATHNAIGWIAAVRGDLRSGEAGFRLGLEQPSLSPIMRAIMTVNLVEVLLMRGALDEAETELARAETLLRDGEQRSWLDIRRAELATWRGDHAIALQIFERKREQEDAAGLRHPVQLVWMSDYFDCLAALGRGDEAIALVRELVDLSAQTGTVFGLGTHQLTLGRLTGDVVELERAVEVLEPSPYRWTAARARLELGAALRRSGQRVQGREHLRIALDYAERNDVVGFADRAREELRLAGARPRSAVLSGVDALTPAEERIARLAAEGRSNKEIAQHLFLTVKTVEMNLVRAYRKLDIKSRRDLPDALQTTA